MIEEKRETCVKRVGRGLDDLLRYSLQGRRHDHEACVEVGLGWRRPATGDRVRLASRRAAE
jgi:hypothetical protein